MIVAAAPDEAVQLAGSVLERSGFQPSSVDLAPRLAAENSAWRAAAFELGSATRAGLADAVTELVPFLVVRRRSRGSLPFTRVVAAARPMVLETAAEQPASEVIIAQQTSSAGSFADVESLVRAAMDEIGALFTQRRELVAPSTSLHPRDVARDCPAHVWEFKRLVKT